MRDHLERRPMKVGGARAFPIRDNYVQDYNDIDQDRMVLV